MSDIFGAIAGALAPIAPVFGTDDWKAQLLPASYNGVGFHVDVRTTASGRREVEHEFAKRDLPYAEDMGRRGARYSITGYLVGPVYIEHMQALMAELEAEGPGELVHPSLGPLQVQPGAYSVTERRERGRMCEFEMSFVEAGAIQSFSPGGDTQSGVQSAASDANTAASSSVDSSLSAAAPGPPVNFPGQP